MSRARRRLVYVLMIGVVGVSLAHAAVGEEHWPYCAYKMYCGLQTERSLEGLRVYGVIDGPGSVEVPLLADRYLVPQDQSRIARGFMRLRKRPGAETRVPGALANLLDRYERRRVAGLHDGPPLKGMRLYDLYWTLDPWARNADQPDRRTLIAEAERPR